MCFFHPSLVVIGAGSSQVKHQRLIDFVLGAGETSRLAGGSLARSIRELRWPNELGAVEALGS